MCTNIAQRSGGAPLDLRARIASSSAYGIESTLMVSP
jgi:hypothetical protein